MSRISSGKTFLFDMMGAIVLKRRVTFQLGWRCKNQNWISPPAATMFTSMHDLLHSREGWGEKFAITVLKERVGLWLAGAVHCQPSRYLWCSVSSQEIRAISVKARKLAHWWPTPPTAKCVTFTHQAYMASWQRQSLPDWGIWGRDTWSVADQVTESTKSLPYFLLLLAAACAAQQLVPQIWLS